MLVTQARNGILSHRLLVKVLEDMHMQEPIFFNQDLLLVSTGRVSLAIRVLLSKYRQLKNNMTSKRVVLSKSTQTQVLLVEEVLELMDLGGGEAWCDRVGCPTEVQHEVLLWPPPSLLSSSWQAGMASHPPILWPEDLGGKAENDMPALMDNPQELETPEKESAPKAKTVCQRDAFDLDEVDLSYLEKDLQCHDSAHHAISKHMKKCQAKLKGKAAKSEVVRQAKSAPLRDLDGDRKNSRKNVYSRHYHQVLLEGRKLSLPEEEAKEKARKAARMAVDGLA